MNGIIFLDLKKAFDHVDHEIVLTKLYFMALCKEYSTCLMFALRVASDKILEEFRFSFSAILTKGVSHASRLKYTRN